MTIDLDEARKALEILYDQDLSDLLTEAQHVAASNLMIALDDGARIAPRGSIVLEPTGFNGWEYTANALERVAEHGDYTSTLHWLALKFREQTRPPKPAEPTGLGAVVEDVDGKRLVRVIDDNDNKTWPWRHEDGSRSSYKYVDVVRVLSEGVSS